MNDRRTLWSETDILTDSDSTAKEEDSHTDTLAEEQTNAGSTDDLVDVGLDPDS